MDSDNIENENGVPIVNRLYGLAADQQGHILDETWAKTAFLVGNDPRYLEESDMLNYTYSSAQFKFIDTSLGGNTCINPRPQFTRYADSRVPGLLNNRLPTSVGEFSGKQGLGRIYNEAFQETQEHIYLRFGVPEFNSLTTFFSGFYNNSAGRLARTGRTNDFFFGTGEAIGTVIGLAGQVILWKVTAVLAVGRVFKWFFNKDTSKFYYLKPTMPNYWSAVNSMVNTIAINRGLIPTFLKPAFVNASNDQKVNEAYRLDDNYLKKLHQLMPDIFSESGGYDVFAMATRAQRMSIMLDNQIYDDFENGSFSDFYGYVKKREQTKLDTPRGEKNVGVNGTSAISIFNWLQRWLKTEVTIPEAGEGANTESDIRKKLDPATGTEVKAAYPNSFSAFLDAELDNGSAFVCFRVDSTGPVQESFSNSVGENELAVKINGTSASARSMTYQVAGGKLDDGIIGSVVGAVLDGAKGVVSGIADSLHISGLLSLAGAAFVDIPKYWQSSAANFPKITYTFRLDSPYGNVVSQMNNIYIPLCALLAGALPLSTGRQSYTSPFICQIYHQGKFQSRLAIIDSVTVNRGVSNLPFNKQKNAMAIEVSFTVADLSSIVHMPISKGYGISGEGIFDDDTSFSDYMAVLGSLGLGDQFYKSSKLALATAKKISNLNTLKSPAAWAMFVADKTPVGLLDILYKGNSNLSYSVAR